MDAGLLRRFQAKIVVEDRGYATPCWIWTGALNPEGYGRVYTGQRTAAGHKLPGIVHRLAFAHWKGPIPDGFDIDHLCRVPACANPDHLEAVPRRENQSRGIKGRLTTHCPQGHEYDQGNTYHTKQGWRLCRACNRERARARAALARK